MKKVYTDGSSLGNPGPAGRAIVLIDEGKETSLCGGAPVATNNQMELQAVIEALRMLLEKHPIQRDASPQGRASEESIDKKRDLGVGLFEEEVAESQLLPEPVTIYTDSEYVQKGVEQWLEGRVARGWRRNGSNEPVKNLNQRKELYRLLQYFTGLSWQWVKGHAGNRYNEKVDKLARKTAHSFAKKSPTTSSDIEGQE